jgi:hypothetical protein
MLLFNEHAVDSLALAVLNLVVCSVKALSCGESALHCQDDERDD